jgi:hypothetical protein
MPPLSTCVSGSCDAACCRRASSSLRATITLATASGASAVNVTPTRSDMMACGVLTGAPITRAPLAMASRVHIENSSVMPAVANRLYVKAHHSIAGIGKAITPGPPSWVSSHRLPAKAASGATCSGRQLRQSLRRLGPIIRRSRSGMVSSTGRIAM